MPTVHRSKPGRGRELPIHLTPTQADTFWLLVEESPSGCWDWNGHLFAEFGYGQYRLTRGRSVTALKAHRVSWTLLRGPIPQGMTIDHLCRNPRCVNPAHLECVSNKINILRGESPTALNAKKTHCAHGHEFTPTNIRWRHRGGKVIGRECRQCEKDKRKRTKAWRSGKHKPKQANTANLWPQDDDV